MGLQLSNDRGLSLIELMIAVAVMAISSLSFLTMFDNQLRANNFLEFKVNTSNLKAAAISQIFLDPTQEQCKCLFKLNPVTLVSGSTVTSAGIPSLTKFGRYDNSTLCDGVISAPMIDTTTVSSKMILSSASLESLVETPAASGKWRGNFVLYAQSTKSVAGPKVIPVDFTHLEFSTDAAGLVNGCSFTGGGGGGINNPNLFNGATNGTIDLCRKKDAPHTCAGDIDDTVQTYPIPGTWSICVYTGQTIDRKKKDASHLESCLVQSLGSGGWQLLISGSSDRDALKRVACHYSCVK